MVETINALIETIISFFIPLTSCDSLITFQAVMHVTSHIFYAFPITDIYINRRVRYYIAGRIAVLMKIFSGNEQVPAAIE